MNDPAPREESLFDAAVQMATPRERAAFLKESCGPDEVLRSRVEGLLRAHDAAGAFLETPACIDVLKPSSAADGERGEPGGTTVDAVTQKPGDEIGRYKLLQVIGEGGCGVVYMAEQQEPVRRRVALKVIKLGMDTRRVIARFEAERQALAMMDHPNIAKVLDAGATENGRPYFVMELVRGIRVTEYCDQNHLPTEERLDLFIQICRAIHHAHQKGIIHRDVKPSNILVTLHDGVPVPKVIDFGIAKATDQRLTDKTLFTEFQSFIGTPAYVSPEQAEMSGLDIDTRSDIYSLGVLLYELITGKTPFDPEQLMRSGLDEMRRTIRESEPVRPSTRLSTMLDVELTATAKRRQADAPRLISRIRGDLDWIVMKCLEKDRTRRYDSASSLIADIERYLNNEPVGARPPSRRYRFQKMVRRNKAACVGSVAVAVALIAGLISSTWLYWGEHEARKESVDAQQEQVRLLRETERARASEANQRERAEAERRIALRTSYNSDMNLVQQAMAANNFGRTLDLLNRHRPGQRTEDAARSRAEGVGPEASEAPRAPAAKSAPTDLRQWEWRYFWNQYRSDAAFALARQSNAISAVSMSADGRFLISSVQPGELKFWDLFRRAEVATFRVGGGGPGFGPGFGAGAFAISSKGDRLAAVVSGERRRDERRHTTVKVWALPTGEIVAEMPIEGAVQSLAFRPDGTQLLVVGQEFGGSLVVRVWDLAKQRVVQETTVKSQEEGFRRRPPVFSPDARRLAISEEGAVIRIIDLATGEEMTSVEAFEEGSVHCMAFSPDGERLAVTAFVTETAIKIFDVQTGALAFKLDGHASWVPGVVFTADGKRLVSAGADQTVRVWDMDKRQELAAFRGHFTEVNCVAVTGDGKTIVSGCKDGSLFGWDGARTDRRKSFEVLPIPMAGVEFLPQSTAMLSINLDGTVSLWDTVTLQETERLTALGDRITRLVVSPDGARVYAGSFSGEIKVLDFATRTIVTNLAGFSGRGGSSFGGPGGPGGPGGAGGPGRSGRGRPGRGGPGPSFASGPIGLIEQGQTLVALGPGTVLRLWDTVSWRFKEISTSNEASPFSKPQLTQAVLLPDERSILMTGRDGNLEFRNLGNGQTDATLPTGGFGASGFVVSPDGSRLAAATTEGTVAIWDLATRTMTDALRGHLLGVHAVAFSPDGQRIASAGNGAEAVKLWDTVTHQEVATLGGQGAFFRSVKFSPGGRLLVAINGLGTAHLWRAPTLAEIEAFERTQALASP